MKYWYFAKKCLKFVVLPVLIVILLRSIYYSRKLVNEFPSVSVNQKIAINEAKVFTETSGNEKQNSFAEKSGITYFRDQIGNSNNTFTRGIQRTSVQYDFKTSDDYFRKDRTINAIDCRRFMSVDGSGTNKTTTSEISLLRDGNKSTTCTELKRGFIHSSLTELEESFPIAYSVLVFKDPAQVLTLLQAIYRPQNIYCIHVDKKSTDAVKTAMSNIARCFDNMFLSSQSINVKWGTYTVLEPEIVCLRDLWNKTVKWRYFINLTGQEFPLKTNYELVKILTAYSGANDVEGRIRRRNPERWKDVGNPPDSLLPVKGAVHVVVSRKFVEFVLTNDTAQRLLKWCEKVKHSSEVFFSTLNFNPQLQVPGSYGSDNVSMIESKPFLARYKIWGWSGGQCSGYYRKSICIFNVGDLPILANSTQLFANKFYWQEGSKLTEYCLAEWIYNRTKEEYFGTVIFDDTYYSSLDFVKRKIN